ncbi:MAG: hypothetical protein BWY54_00746 [Candidatus Dependentiae bacterium ADurb.Bin331]|nr:MAG: hypothetical protein BWY54_00746 [Candidatus Dependentiae bacterium ADurb.Bin331]
MINFFWLFLLVSSSGVLNILGDTTRRRGSNGHLESTLPVPTGSAAYIHGHECEGSAQVQYTNLQSNQFAHGQTPVQGPPKKSSKGAH